MAWSGGGRDSGRVKRSTRGRRVPQFVLLGERAIESKVDHNLVGTVDAFAFRARRSGTAASISVYLDARDRASTSVRRLVFEPPRSPSVSPDLGFAAALGLAHGTRSLCARRLCVRSDVLARGSRQGWRHLLPGPRRPVVHRQTSSGSGLSALPRRWPAGATSHLCRISAYVKGTARASSLRAAPPVAPRGLAKRPCRTDHANQWQHHPAPTSTPCQRIQPRLRWRPPRRRSVEVRSSGKPSRPRTAPGRSARPHTLTNGTLRHPRASCARPSPARTRTATSSTMTTSVTPSGSS